MTDTVDFSKKRLRTLRAGGATLSDLQSLFGDQELFDQFIKDDLNKLYLFTQRQLAYHEALNDLPQNEVDPYDLIDRAVIEVLAQKPDSTIKFGHLLYATVLKNINKKVDELERRERRETSIDNNVPDAVVESGSNNTDKTLGDYVLDFWQPDQDLKLADLIIDEEVPSPAELEDMRSRQTEVYQGLDALPIKWREDFIFFAVERWSLKKIADLRGVAEKKIREQIRATQAFLRERLRDKMMLSNRPHQTS